MPYLVRNPSACEITRNEDNQFYVSRVRPKCAIFRIQFSAIPGVLAAVEHDVGDLEVKNSPRNRCGVARDILAAEPAVALGVDLGNRSSVAAEVREVAPDVLLPMLPRSAVRARADAVSIEHPLSHFPRLQDIRCVTFAVVPSSFQSV